MLKTYLIAAWRSLSHRRTNSLITIAGLAIGIAASLLIFRFVRFEQGYDQQHREVSTIFRIVTQTTYSDGIRYNSGAPYPTPEAIKASLPQFSKVSAARAQFGSQFSVSQPESAQPPGSAQSSGSAQPPEPAQPGRDTQKMIENEGVWFLEPDYFSIMDAHWLAGTPTVLEDPASVVLDRMTAAKYFGDWQKAIGQRLILDNKIPLMVGGIIENPVSNTDFPIHIALSYNLYRKNTDYGYMKDYWGGIDGSNLVFVRLAPSARVDLINGQLLALGKSHFEKEIIKGRQLLLFPLTENHFDSRFGFVSSHITTHANLRTLTLIGIFIILMAAINFINLATANSILRTREIGVRKVLGGTRRQIIIQLLGETLLTVILSSIIAGFLAWVSFPAIRQTVGLPDTLPLLDRIAFTQLLIICLSVTLLAGGYPALAISGFGPVAALRNRINTTRIGGISLRRALVIVQFVLSQVLIAGTIVAISQMSFIRHASLGFDKDAILVLNSAGDDRLRLPAMHTLKDRLLQDPDIQSVSLNSAVPSTRSDWKNSFHFNGSAKAEDFNTAIKCGDADYFKTFDLRMAAGRPFRSGDSVDEVVVNETMTRLLGCHKPADILGKTFKWEEHGKWLTIVGVVKDFVNNTMRDRIAPTVIMPLTTNYTQFAVKFLPAKLPAVQANAQRQWKALFPAYVYDSYFLDQQIDGFYAQDQRLTFLYKLFSTVALFISCLGLYGLISFIVARKTREVGIRKTLGASVAGICYLLSKEFLYLLLLAFLVACPLSWILMDHWLEDFAYRISIGPDVFIIDILLCLLVTALTVGIKAARAAMANPVKSLKVE